MKYGFRENNRGQVVVITALLVALMLLSTVVYVTAIIKQEPVMQSYEYDLTRQYQQSLKNTLISALASVSNNGSSQVLDNDVTKLNQLFNSHYYQSMFEVSYSLANVSPYQNGLWVSQGQQNHAILSAQVGYNIGEVANSKSSQIADSINVTSEAFISGSCVSINATAKQTTLTVNVLDDGVLAPATNFVCSYQFGSDWLNVDNFSLVDTGVGTYKITVPALVNQSSDPLVVALTVSDVRGIIMRVTSTCTGL